MKTILFVEDDPLMLEELTSLVDWESAGYGVVTAINGKQGLLRYEEHRPEIIITDIKMPRMDGLEMMQIIRERNPYVCFMFLSSYEDYAYMREALQLGAVDYIRKTSLTEELLRTKADELWKQWEQNLQTAKTMARGRLRELCESGVADPDIILRLRTICQCFPQEELFVALHQDACRSLCRKFAPDESLFDEIVHALQPTVPNSMAQITEHIHANLSDPDLTNAKLARLAGLSERQFSTRFREHTGHSPGDYITMVRMEEAKRLLENGKMVYEVAESLGYSTPQYFSVAFKQYSGQTPTEYRTGAKG